MGPVGVGFGLHTQRLFGGILLLPEVPIIGVPPHVVNSVFVISLAEIGLGRRVELMVVNTLHIHLRLLLSSH